MELDDISGLKLGFGLKVLYWLYKKMGELLLKSAVQEHGKLHFGKVSSQGQIDSFLVECNVQDRDKLKVRDLKMYLKRYLHSHINSRYLKKQANDSTKVLINFTRISTFFLFTDGENILLFDRPKAKNIQTVVNDRLDCFGSVDFENSSLSVKITNYGFFESDISKIETIPGFAFEDNIEKNAIGIETVIMFGFIIYLTKEQLKLAESEYVLIRKIKDLNNVDGLTSKAKLGIEYLTFKGNCDEK